MTRVATILYSSHFLVSTVSLALSGHSSAAIGLFRSLPRLEQEESSHVQSGLAAHRVTDSHFVVQ
jgi:hypothetical protein